MQGLSTFAVVLNVRDCRFLQLAGGAIGLGPDRRRVGLYAMVNLRHNDVGRKQVEVDESEDGSKEACGVVGTKVTTGPAGLVCIAPQVSDLYTLLQDDGRERVAPLPKVISEQMQG